MTSRERIKRIIAGEAADRCGFWLGNPHWETIPIMRHYFGTKTDEDLHQRLGSDLRWIPAGSYKHPEGKPVFDMRRRGRELSAEGYFADCEELEEVEAYEWPNPDYLDFTDTLASLRNSGEIYRASGFWSPFFHEVMDIFGLEKYFTKMYTHPEIVTAVTERIVGFYLEANRRFFEAAGDLVDGFFFGNDFGTQKGIMVSPDLFDRFVFPYLRQLTDLGKAHGYQTILHSCGSIHRVIPDLIACGVDALHPLQALAADMDAETLTRDFKGKVAFIGGVDTQELLGNGSPEQVRVEVHRLIDVLGPNLVVSPSHEAILPNVPMENIVAMAKAVVEG
jgi:uroporphyrinogen decarboxylase